MSSKRFGALKVRYEEVRRGLDRLQEEVLARGIEMRPGLRRQFDDALRGLFYTLACADGRIDEREVAFYNFLFDEELSVKTFELVREQLQKSSGSFEEDLLATVAAFASYDKTITGEIPLDAPSLSALLMSAAETVGNMVSAADGVVDETETAALDDLMLRCKQRARIVFADAEALLKQKGSDEYDPDAAVSRDLRGVTRLVCAMLTEAVLQGADVAARSGLPGVDESASDLASAAHFVADSVRSDLERGKATIDLVTLVATQVRPILESLSVISAAGESIQPAWRALAEETSASIDSQVGEMRQMLDVRIRVLREKHDWHPDVDNLERGLNLAWQELG